MTKPVDEVTPGISAEATSRARADDTMLMAREQEAVMGFSSGPIGDHRGIGLSGPDRSQGRAASILAWALSSQR